MTGNAITLRILAHNGNDQHPETYLRLRFPTARGKWGVALDGCAETEFETLADVMHAPSIPRGLRGSIRDLLTNAALWAPNRDESQT